MAKKTHAQRLELLYQKISKITQHGDFSNQLMASNCVDSDELNTALTGATDCFSALSEIVKCEDRFTDGQRNMYLRRLGRIGKPIERKSLAMNGSAFRRLLTSEQMKEDLEDLHLNLEARQVYELMDAQEVSELAKKVAELKKALLSSTLDAKLKLTLNSLLTRMEEVFATYGELGAQDIVAIAQRWTGVLVAHNDLISEEAQPEIREKSFGLARFLWAKIRQGSDLIQITQAYAAARSFIVGS